MNIKCALCTQMPIMNREKARMSAQYHDDLRTPEDLGIGDDRDSPTRQDLWLDFIIVNGLPDRIALPVPTQ